MEENNKEKSTIGIAGFVLGIISILSALFFNVSIESLCLLHAIIDHQSMAENLSKDPNQVNCSC